METALETFAKNLVKIRKIRGWTQQQLAELVGVSITTIALYESQDRFPTTNNLKRLAKSLKVSELDFFKSDLQRTDPKTIPLLSREQLKQIIPHDLALEIVVEAFKKKKNSAS